MACNYFNVIIFNVENFTNKNVRVKRGGLINLINFYRYYLIYSKQGWFSSCLFHFCVILLLIVIYTVLNFFSLLWLIFLCPFVGWWTPRNNGCCFIISLIILYWYIIVVCFLPWFYPKNHNVWNFFGCSMYGNIFLICCFTKHRAPSVELSFFVSKNVTYVFFESTTASSRPCVVGVLGAPWTCDMEFELQNSWILFPVNSFPLSLCNVFGNPNVTNTFCGACTTC